MRRKIKEAKEAGFLFMEIKNLQTIASSCTKKLENSTGIGEPNCAHFLKVSNE